ncbi:hypothetical protein HAX54_049301 [Datura stramonium]|uniref:Bifunctional inhibitor/plant lipid transfer protein/seed storage helical domain-containing protein n=1 Tax=Datura stramonium TaxID=4076 RepID=A0ABS8SUP0_DATST|nr:hypothetical protein [Datura stramonium]
MTVTSPPPVTEAEAITCDTVHNSIKPCLNYMMYGGSVTEECCTSCTSCIAKGTTALDRQTMCSCIKDLASFITDEQIDRVASIPGQCGGKVPFKISKDVDCSKKNWISIEAKVERILIQCYER